MVLSSNYHLWAGVFWPGNYRIFFQDKKILFHNKFSSSLWILRGIINLRFHLFSNLNLPHERLGSISKWFLLARWRVALIRWLALTLGNHSDTFALVLSFPGGLGYPLLRIVLNIFLITSCFLGCFSDSRNWSFLFNVSRSKGYVENFKL